jgi:membrane-associated protease RseP (regulator of RpoE activity)
MGRIATVIVIVLGLATAARAASQCDEARERTGLAVVVRDGALVVSEVASDSAAAASGVRAGDVVVQVNGTIAHSCAEWARAMTDARDGRKALLLLVARRDGDVPLALGRRTWGEVPGEATSVASAPVAPTRRAVPETPPPLPPDVVVSVDSVVAGLGALVGQTRQGLDGYRDAVVGARRAVETLAVRNAAPADTVTALRRVARLHETAVLAWESIDVIRARDGIARRLPVSEAATAPFFSESQIQSMLDEFDFLHETVAAEPRGGRFSESSGEWRPAAARRIAWEHAGEELGRTTATLAATP